MEKFTIDHKKEGAKISNSIKMEQNESKAPPHLDKGQFQKVMLTIIAGLILAGVLKLFGMSEQIVRLDERDRQKVEKIDAIQAGQNKIMLDIYELKDRLYRVETNQNNQTKK